MLITVQLEKVEDRYAKALTNMEVRLENKFVAIRYTGKRAANIQNSQALGKATGAMPQYNTRSDSTEKEPTRLPTRCPIG